MNCDHRESKIANNMMYRCIKCGVFTHKRCQVKSKNGEQCWLVNGHENSDYEMDRKHWALVIAK